MVNHHQTTIGENMFYLFVPSILCKSKQGFCKNHPFFVSYIPIYIYTRSSMFLVKMTSKFPYFVLGMGLVRFLAKEPLKVRKFVVKLVSSNNSLFASCLLRALPGAEEARATRLISGSFTLMGGQGT